MYNVSVRITGREEDAQDVLQESFISAYRNIQSYRGDSPFGSWMKRIVVNRSINVIRSRKAELWPDDEHFDVGEEDAPELYKENLSVERVRQAIMQLPDGYRSVLSSIAVLLIPRKCRILRGKISAKRFLASSPSGSRFATGRRPLLYSLPYQPSYSHKKNLVKSNR